MAENFISSVSSEEFDKALLGGLDAANGKFAKPEDIPPVPVQSVNGKTGEVTVDTIIDVIALPETDIDDKALYRLLTGTFVYNQLQWNAWTCYCVESLPEVGEPATNADLSMVTAYYNIADGELYAYVDDALSAVFGVPAGWYPASVLFQAAGWAYNGVITNILDDPMDNSFSLLLEYVLYSYKENWTSMKPIGRAGTGPNAEVFNHPSNIALGTNSHAEGAGTAASGNNSHAEGAGTAASGNNSHAEGDGTAASGNNSHAEGVGTTASGDASHAEGLGTIVSFNYQHVQGTYNAEDANNICVHIVGNGPNPEARSNAHTLDWDGNAWFAGDVYVGSTSGKDKDEGSKKLATVDEVAEAVEAAKPEIVQATGDSASAVMSQKAVTDALASLEQVQLEFVDSVEKMTDTSKFYVMDGFIYAYMLTEVEAGPSYTNVLPLAINADGTPYVGTNGEKGYKTGWRLNSSAVEKESAGNCITGFIPIKGGQTIRIKNVTISAASNGYFHWFNGAFVADSSAYYENYDGDGYSTKPDANGLIRFNAPSSTTLAYFRMSTGVISDATIITLDEEITEGGGTTTGYAWTNTGHAFAPADYEDRIVSLENDVDVLKETVENIEKEETVDKITLISDWDAPIYDANIPVFQLSEEKAAMTNAAQTPADIYARYDALMEKHPNYITKTDLGLCSDGVNHVYRYDFREPDSRHTSGYDWSETKTKAIIVSGIHFEWSGIYGLYYALEEIAENPDLFSFRRNTHLIVVPCMNPYATIVDNYQSGLATPNSYGVRNANGVEIHRNFEVGWALTEAGTTHYGGAEPLSEVETQYVDAIMKENTDAALFLTCHSFADTSFNFIWPSVATKYMCNMGYRLIDKLSNAWMKTHGAELIGLEDYRGGDIPAWDNRLGFAHISQTPGTETRQGTKYGIQSANVEICGRFWTHGTTENPEPSMSSFTMSRGAEVYVNFLLTVFGCYDYKDKAEYGG